MGSDEPITAAKVFTTIALFNVLRFPFAFLPMGFLQYLQAKIAMRRLSAYLELPELGNNVIPEAPPGVEDGSLETKDASITIRNGSFGWIDPNEETGPLKSKKEKKSKKKTDVAPKEN